VKKFSEKYDEMVTDSLGKVEGFKAYYMHGILKDTSGTAGMEIIRRIVGVAQVADITSITDEEARAQVEMKMLYIAKALIMKREIIKNGQDYLDIINEFSLLDALEGEKC